MMTGSELLADTSDPTSWMQSAIRLSRRHEIAILLAILIVTLGVRIGAAFWWQSRIDGVFRFGDSETYWELAEKLAAGQPYEYGPNRFQVFRTPGYPAILAPLFWIFGDHPPVMAARLLGAVLGTLAVGGIWWWARSLFGQFAGLIAAGIGAVYPGAIVTSIFVLSEAAFCPLLVLNLVLWGESLRETSERRASTFAVLNGVAFGCGVLVRPSWLLFPPFAIALGLLIASDRGKQVRVAAITLVAGLVTLCPWWVRNASVTGRFVPTTLQTGASLYDGLHPGATGASDMRFVAKFEQDERLNPSSDEPLEIRLNQRLTEESLSWTRQHPCEAIRLGGVKFLRMWNISPNEPSFSSLLSRLGIAMSYGPVLVLALLGAISNFRRGFSYMLCWLPALYFSLLHMVFIGSIRYRQPAMLGLMVLAAGTVAAFLWKRPRCDRPTK